MFCNIGKTIDIGMLLKQHELADASEDKDDVTRRDKKLSKLYVRLSILLTRMNWLFPSYRSQKAQDRYKQNFQHLFELTPGLKHLIGSSDCRKTAEHHKIMGKVSICAYIRAFMLSGMDH
jgi:hypothetical protein